MYQTTVIMFESNLAHRRFGRGRRHPITSRPRAPGGRPINVPGDYPTIQQAINAANPGDTIHLKPQTYIEQVTIHKDLILVGSGANSTIIQSPPVLSLDPFRKRFIVEISNGAIVSMTGLTITGPDG